MKVKKLKSFMITCLACVMVGTSACNSGSKDTNSSSSIIPSTTSSSSQGIDSSSSIDSSSVSSTETSSSESLVSSSTSSSSSEITSSEISSSEITSSSSSSEAQKLTINFNTNGGQLLDSMQWEVGTQLSLPRAIRHRYRQNGWYYDSACTNLVEENNPNMTNGITLYAGWTQVYEIRLYTNEWDYTSMWYAEGETVDIAAWGTPTMDYDGEELAFSCWKDELLENTVTQNFTMGTKSMAFYAQYNGLQAYAWNYNKDTGVYTSTGQGLKPIKNVGNYYGTIQADMIVSNRASTDIGIAFNASIPTNINKPHEANCRYWYMHLNPTKAGVVFQLSYVTPETGYKVVESAGKDAVASWATKFDEFVNKGLDELVTNFKIEYTPTYIKCYVDNVLVINYTGELLNTLGYKDFAIRTSHAGNRAENLTYTAGDFDIYEIELDCGQVCPNEKTLFVPGSGTNLILPNVTADGYRFIGWYLDENLTNPVTSDYRPTAETTLYAKWLKASSSSNGYYLFSDGAYTSCQASGYSVINVPGMSGNYGIWESDITIDRYSANSKFGLIIRSDATASSEQKTFEGVNCYYFYHNSAANLNFTLATEVNGTYKTFGGHKAYANDNGFILDVNDPAYNEVLAYYNANNAIKAGLLDSYTIRFGIEITNECINLYINGKLYLNYTEDSSTDSNTDLTMFDSNANCVGVGFATQSKNTTFSNYKWTPIKYENGFKIVGSSTYTSTLKNAMTTVDGLGGQYGTWEVDVTVTDRANKRVGIFINANIADNKIYGQEGSGQGFYFHHSVSANGRFVLVDYYDTYKGYSTLANTTADLKSIGVAGETMLAYQAREKDFLDGKTDSVTMRMGIRVTPDKIELLLDGVVIGTYTGEYCTLFSQGAAATGNAPAITASTGVGFTSETLGTTFSNFTFTPYKAS